MRPIWCTECNERVIAVEKWGLCNRCYQRFIRSNGKISTKNFRFTPINRKNQPHKREITFIQNFFTHNEWTYEPAMFYLGELRYTPNFYDKQRDVFIEVVGSRQAYHGNKDKYELFKEFFPGITLELRTEDGMILGERDRRPNPLDKRRTSCLSRTELDNLNAQDIRELLKASEEDHK